MADPGVPATWEEALNRGLNLLVAVALGVSGLTFGSDLFAEMDALDKIDNSLLALVGVVAVVWYFTGRHWAQRSAVPVYLTVAALAAQVLGLGIEMGDSNALGDDIPGMILYVTLLVVVVLIYQANGRYLAARGSQGPPTAARTTS